MSIKMEVINDENQHFLVTFARPGRIEISVVEGEIIAHVYDGAEVDMDQEPIGGYDATLSGTFANGNESWESEPGADTKPVPPGKAYIGYGAL